MISIIIASVLNFSPVNQNLIIVHENKLELSVYKQIKRNNPKLPEWYIIKLTHTIQKVTDKYKLPKKLYTAILMQESAYNLKAKRCSNGLCTDFGIGQVHISSVKRYKLSKDLLTKDLDYSIESSAKILHDFKKMYSKKERNYWTRYNSSNKDFRNLYASQVSRWY